MVNSESPLSTTNPPGRISPKQLTIQNYARSPLGTSVILALVPGLSILLTGPHSFLTGITLFALEAFVGVILVANSVLLGDFVAGLAVGFHFDRYSAGPILIERRHPGVSIKIRWTWYPLFGSVQLTPRISANLRRGIMISLIGRILPLVLIPSLIFGSLVMGFGVSSLPVAPRQVLYASATVSVIMLLYHIIFHDVQFLAEIAKQTPVGSIYVSAYQLAGEMAGAQRPREWSSELIHRTLNRSSGTYRAATPHLIAFLHERDKGDLATAGVHVEAAFNSLDNQDSRVRSALFLQDHDLSALVADAISFAAVYRVTVKQSPREWLTELAEAGAGKEVLLRAEPGVLLGERQWDMARQAATEAQTVIEGETGLCSGWNQAALEWLESIQKVTDEQLIQTQPDCLPTVGPTESQLTFGPADDWFTQLDPPAPIASNPTHLTIVFLAIAVGLFAAALRYPRLLDLAALPITVMFMMICHTMRQVGRSVFGRIAGYRIHSFYAGPLVLQFRPRWNIRFNRQWWRWFGREISVPPPVDNLRTQSLIRLIGGIVGPVVAAFTLIFLWITMLILNIGVPHTTGWFTVKLLLILLILVLFLASIVFGYAFDLSPLKILLDEEGSTAWAAVDGLFCVCETGDRPRDWNPRWVAQATADVAPFLEQIDAHRFAYFHEIDRGNIEQAGKYLDEALKLAEGDRTVRGRLIRSEAAFFEAYYRQNPVKALEWLCFPEIVPPSRAAKLRAHAAILLATGHRELARDRAREALAALDPLFEPSIVPLVREWLDEIAGLEPEGRYSDPTTGPGPLKPVRELS